MLEKYEKPAVEVSGGGDELDLRNLLTLLYKYRSTILLSIVICSTLALLYSVISKPIYRGTARILVESSRPRINKVENMILPDYSGRANFYNSQIEVLRSHILAKLVYQELKGRYIPWSARTGMASKQSISDENCINELLEAVTIKPVRLTQIIEINADDPDPKLAADIANIWTGAYILFSSSDQLLQRKFELEADIEQQLKYVKDKHPIIQGLRSEIESIDNKINNEKLSLKSLENIATQHGGLIKDDALITNVKVLDQAQVPQLPVRPNKAVNFFIGVFFGFLIGIILTFVFESLDQSIRTPSDVESIVKISCLASIPFYTREKNTPKLPPELISANDSRSLISENFRALRTSIFFSNPDVSKKSLVITSSGPLEGKTTVAVNLAVSFAQAYERTLLVDADLRKPRLHTLFNLNRPGGLTELLAYDNEEAVSVIHDSGIPNLQILTAGAIPPNPSEILGSKKMGDLIKKLSSQYDRIILDAPPILAAADAVILSTKTDAVIMVISAGSTYKQAAAWSARAITSVHSRLLGAVLNKVRTREAQSHYYYYYQYGKEKKRKNDKTKNTAPSINTRSMLYKNSA